MFLRKYLIINILNFAMVNTKLIVQFSRIQIFVPVVG